MELVNHIEVLSLGVSEMIFFAIFWKRPINLKKFNFYKTFCCRKDSAETI